MHSRNYMHRDIKPENFCMGTGKKQNVMYLIDFGLAKRYIDAQSGQHIKPKVARSAVGTVDYTSINCHRS